MNFRQRPFLENGVACAISQVTLEEDSNWVNEKFQALRTANRVRAHRYLRLIGAEQGNLLNLMKSYVPRTQDLPESIHISYALNKSES